MVHLKMFLLWAKVSYFTLFCYHRRSTYTCISFWRLMYKYIQSNLKKLSLLKIRKFYRFMFFWINLMVYTESVWKFYSKFMSENMNRNVFENLCRKWLNNIFWPSKKINDSMKWTVHFLITSVQNILFS